MNDRYVKATKACIEGLPAFGLRVNVDEANLYVAALLQRSVIEIVKDPLKEIIMTRGGSIDLGLVCDALSFPAIKYTLFPCDWMFICASFYCRRDFANCCVDIFSLCIDSFISWSKNPTGLGNTLIVRERCLIQFAINTIVSIEYGPRYLSISSCCTS